jgi:transcriptional regulator with XRE-family HTH domain
MDPQDAQDRNDHVVFGRNIRALRDSANISREVVSERAGITVEYLGEVERGEKWPTLKVIRAIARALRVSPATFFAFDDQDPGTAIEKVHSALENRTPEQQQQAVRVVRALFDL